MIYLVHGRYIMISIGSGRFTGYEWDDYWIYPPVSSKVAGGKIPYTLEMLTGTSLSILEMGDSTLPCLISNLSRGEHMKKKYSYIYICM